MNWKLLMAMVAGVLLFAGCGDSSDSEIAHSTTTEGQDETITSGNGGFEFNGLYWQVGPDRAMNWYEAKEWVDGLDGYWRMPTIDELEGLWDAGIAENNWGPFDNSGYCVWSGDIQYSVSAWGFAFNWGGREDWAKDIRVPYQRAFAVRSR